MEFENVINKINLYGIDLKQAKDLASRITVNDKATKEEKEIAAKQVTELTYLISEVIIAIDVLSKSKSIDKQNDHWNDVQLTIEKRPRNSIGTAIACLHEKYLLIKK